MSWNWLSRRLLFSLPAETAHVAAMRSFVTATNTPGMAGLLERRYCIKDDRLRVSCFGIDFENPIGLAAGFDKNAEWFHIMPVLGFGHIEVGTITAQPQPGNERPRLFRLTKDTALLNRMGFNNHGCKKAALAIDRHQRKSVVGVNIGKTKVVDIDQALGDYLESFETLFPHADYMTINVSSPNTPGLRQLQDRDRLQELLQALAEKNQSLANSRNCEVLPLLLKIAPDLTESQLEDVVQISLDAELAGIIATNTTIDRAGLKTSKNKLQELGAGGISGKPLTTRSRDFVRRIYLLTQGRLPIIGVGGIMCGEDAWKMICAGASLVQVYTGFVYGGPGFVKTVNRHLLSQIKKRQLGSIAAAIGIDAKD